MKRNLDNIKKLIEAMIKDEAEEEKYFTRLKMPDNVHYHKHRRWVLEDLLSDISCPEYFDKACRELMIKE